MFSCDIKLKNWKKHSMIKFMWGMYQNYVTIISQIDQWETYSMNSALHT
jgi:hypothetical protein